ncbi:MAG: C40 family peptidase [Candidatus Dormibacteria bacterium]
MTSTMAAAPEAVEEALADLCRQTGERYAMPMLGVTAIASGLIGFTAIPAQKARLEQVVAASWPGARTRILVLAARRARLLARPQGRVLDIWRHPRSGDPEGGRERATQLLPGDPPAEVVAFRGCSLLLRAPGQALGWIDRDADFSLEAASSGPAPTPGPGSPWDAAVVLGVALSHLGEPYVWGGTGGGGFDCSGLIWRSFLTAGVLLPKHSRQQRLLGRRAARREMLPGDLVAAVSRGPRRTSHVALAITPEEVVHACSELGEVRREPLADLQRRYRILTVRRLQGELGSDR